MAIQNKNNLPLAPIPYTKVVDSPADYSGLTNNTYFKDLSDELIYWKDLSGEVVGLFNKTEVGKVGVTNGAGKFTYYNDVKTAIESATSGQVVFLFADCETTTSINLPANVSLEGNSFKIYNHQADGTKVLELNSTVAHKTNWSNITFERLNGVNAYAVAILRPGAGNVELTCSNALVTSDNSQYAVYSANNNIGSFIKGLHIKAVTGLFTPNIIITSCDVRTTTGYCYFLNAGKLINCYGESLTGAVFVPNACIMYNCYGKTASGTVNAVYPGVYYNSVLESSSGSIDGGVTATLYNSTVSSTSSTFLVSGRAENSVVRNNGTGAAFQTFGGNVPSENSKFYSAGNVVANITNPAGNMQFTNCIIQSAWNNAGGHGIVCGTNSKITGCKIKVANASANCITSGTAYMANNTYEGATTPVAATQLITNVTDNQGNILM